MGLCPECLIKAGFPTGAGSDTGSMSHPAFVPPAVEEIARLFPQLEILELIGRGGMGAVYKARQKQLNRLVALKILPPGIDNEPAFAERFTREARALAQLNHPNIVTLYEFGETSGQFYFLMEFVDGVNLRQLLTSSRVSPREALAIVPQICDALQFAHDQGIVHRDIKPENILLDRRGRVKVADFGLAKLVGVENEPTADGGVPSVSPELTVSGKIMGTPNYMAPEQVHHPAEVDHRADIYALGVVFYQMLTGELPGRKIEAPSKKVQIDVRLDEVVLRAMEKKPGLRYQQVSEVKMMVENIAAMNPNQMEPPSQPQPATRTTNPNAYRSFWGWVVLLTGAAAFVVIAVFGIRFLLNAQTMLGPLDSDAASAGANWIPDAKGGGSVSVDLNDPATKGGYDFALSNTSNFVAGAENYAVWRCPIFPVGPAADGARPITLSFKYKLVDPVTDRNNLRLQLRFWDSTGTGFMGERNVRVGAWTGDSAMTGYRTITVTGILAPPKAGTIDVAIYANVNAVEPWVSGTGRFADIFVTTTTHSLLLNAAVGAIVLAAIGALIMLLFLIGSGKAPANQSQLSAQFVLKSSGRGAVVFAGVAVCGFLTVFAIQYLFKKQVLLGPPNYGTSGAIADWIPDMKGEGSVSADFIDPATRGGFDFVLSNTIAGPTNNADCRCPLFPLGPATGGKRPITFSFAYKLPATVTKGNDIHVNLRFFDATGMKFFSQRVILVGAQSGDSAMTGYRTITVTGIKAPQRAQTADVWINANSFDPWWVSGPAQFADLSVTTGTHSLLSRACVTGMALIVAGALIPLLVRFWRCSTPVFESIPMSSPVSFQPAAQTANTTNYKSLWRGAVMMMGVVAGLALAVLAIYFLLQKPMILGPGNPGAEDNSDGWWVAANGGARSFFIIDHTDPASGDYDFTLGNTNIDGDNSAERRSVIFPLGPAASGAKPLAFSFAYKLPDEVNAGDNLLVKLRFFDRATNFLSEKNFWVGSRSGDSTMAHYKTITAAGIAVPRRAEVADVVASVNSYGEHWSSGTARFDDFSVTTAPHSVLFKIVAVVGATAGIGVLILLLVGFWRRHMRLQLKP